MAAINGPSSVGNARDAGAVGQQSLDQRIQDTRNQIQQLRSQGSHGGPGSSGAGGDETIEALLKLLNKLLEQKKNEGAQSGQGAQDGNAQQDGQSGAQPASQIQQGDYQGNTPVPF